MRKNCLFVYFKRIPVVILTGVIAIACMSCSLLEWEYRSISDSQYYTGEQIEEIFYANEEEFDEVAKIVQENDAVQKSIDESDVSYARIMSNGDEKYFTDEEWSKILAFFENVKPMEIDKYDTEKRGYGQEGDSIIAIYFPKNNKGKSVALYYINMPDEIEVSMFRAQNYDAFKRIGEHWWLGEELDGNPLNDISSAYSYYEDGEWHIDKEAQKNAWEEWMGTD